MNDWSQFTTDITAQQRRDMWDWDRRRRCPWLYENEEVPAEDEYPHTDAPAAGSAPVAGLIPEKE